METLNTIVRFFQEGGPFMYPIALVLVVGLVIALERWIFLGRARRYNRRAYRELLPALKQGDYASAMQIAQDSRAPIGQIILAGIQRMQSTPARDAIENAMEEGVMEALPRLERRTHYLATLANVATLLGLLGTIIGLIAAFTAVASADTSWEVVPVTPLASRVAGDGVKPGVSER